jgi:segregation and condensation protein B
MSKRKKQKGAEQAARPEDADAHAHAGGEDESAGADEPTEVEATADERTLPDVIVDGDASDERTEETPLASASVEEVDAAVESALGIGTVGSGGFDDPAAPIGAADASDSDAKTPPVEFDMRAMNRHADSGDDTVEMSIDAPPAGDEAAGWEEPTRVGAEAEMAELAAQSMAEPSGEHGAEGGDEGPPVDSAVRLESILESLIFASDRPLALVDFKRLCGERDAKKLTAALEALQARHRGTGLELASTAGGWQFRTSAENAAWVAKLIAGRPARLSRAMLETLAIVAYRQPITRPEIDEIRGVDCGPVLKTLLDRALIRMIGKKEEVGRPILYGTTPEFLRTFSLKDLTELPTLRQFHELGAAEQAKVDAEAPLPGAAEGGAPVPRVMPAPSPLPDQNPEEEDALLAELDEATSAATRATRSPDPAPAPSGDEPATQATE